MQSHARGARTFRDGYNAGVQVSAFNQGLTNYSVGVTDVLSFGLGIIAREIAQDTGLLTDEVDEASAAYLSGTATGMLMNFYAALSSGMARSGVIIEQTVIETAETSAPRVASTAVGQNIQGLRQFLQTSRGPWRLASAHAEGATSTTHALRGGVSIEEVYVNVENGARLIRHVVIGPGGKIHETFRTVAKFGL